MADSPKHDCKIRHNRRHKFERAFFGYISSKCGMADSPKHDCKIRHKSKRAFFSFFFLINVFDDLAILILHFSLTSDKSLTVLPC